MMSQGFKFSSQGPCKGPESFYGWPKNSFYSKWGATMGSGSWNLLVLPCSPSPWSSWPEGRVEWPFEASVIVPPGWQHLAGLGSCPLRCKMFSQSATDICCCFSQNRDSWVRKQRLEMRTASLNITHGASLAKNAAFCLWNVGFCWSRGISSPKRNISTGNTEVVPLSWTSTLDLLLWTCLASESTGKEEGYCPVWGDCLDFQRGEWGVSWYSHSCD